MCHSLWTVELSPLCLRLKLYGFGNSYGVDKAKSYGKSREWVGMYGSMFSSTAKVLCTRKNEYFDL